jgi:hypothetical protein
LIKTYEIGSGNVFAGLSLPPNQEHQLKAALVVLGQHCADSQGENLAITKPAH